MKKQALGKTIVPVSRWIPDSLFEKIQKTIPIACVDLIILRENKKASPEILLIKRKIYPEEGKWCLIGGRILRNEATIEAINRQAKGELGVSVKIIKPWTEESPFAVYNDSHADKQKHFIALTFPVKITKGNLHDSGPEFNEAKWFTLEKFPKPLGFHHKKVLTMLKRYLHTKNSI